MRESLGEGLSSSLSRAPFSPPPPLYGCSLTGIGGERAAWPRVMSLSAQSRDILAVIINIYRSIYIYIESASNRVQFVALSSESGTISHLGAGSPSGAAEMRNGTVVVRRGDTLDVRARAPDALRGYTPFTKYKNNF